MKIFVKVSPWAKEEKIEKVDENQFEVWVKEPPIKGRANQAVCKALADFFNVSVSKVQITAGHTSKNKIIEIEN